MLEELEILEILEELEILEILEIPDNLGAPHFLGRLAVPPLRGGC